MHYVRADVILRAANSSLFRRDRPASALMNSPRSVAPKINRLLLNEILSNKHDDVKGVRLIRGIKGVNVDKNCYGKILSELTYKILSHVLYINGRPSLAKAYANRILFDSFFDYIVDKTGSPPSRYYRSILNSI